MVIIEEESGDSGPHEKAEACRKAGNELLAKGDYADACQHYDEGLLAIVRESGDSTSDLRMALHLNAALAHLRRSNLASAVDHATGALAMDPKSVKALYRRGLARLQLSEHPGHHSDAALARADLEDALRLEPGNAEVRGHLQRLRSAARAEKKEVDKSQREAFKGIFATDKPLYEEKTAAEVKPMIHADAGAVKHQMVLSSEGIHFYYDRSEEVLRGVDLVLRGGWCVGLFGNNASGKTTLARLLSGKLKPSCGKILHHLEAPAQPHASRGRTLAASAPMAVVVAGVALAAAAHRQRGPGGIAGWQWAVMAATVCLLAAIAYKCVLAWCSARATRCQMLHVTSETPDKEVISGKKTIESVIGDKLSRSLTPEERRAKVVAMLRAANFQMYNQATGEPVGTPADYVHDKLQYGNLSGGQRHLIYVLRCFAERPQVLICDELLGGLDAWRQPRVLHMLRRMKEETGAAVLFIGTELHQLRLACDSLGFLHQGRVCELGPTEEVLDFPKHPATKDYIQQYRGLPGGHVIGGKLAESYTGLIDDEELRGPWLPP